MRIPSSVTGLLLYGLIFGCAPTIPPVTPPESYKGPVAEQPVVRPGEYWVYQTGSLNKGKTTALPANLGFPLWLGKTWSYEGESLPIGRSGPTSKAFKIATRTTCVVTAFKQVTVTAGTFDAFECECSCSSIENYDRGCGQMTIWYAPDVKNILKRKTDSSGSTIELIQYKASR